MIHSAKFKNFKGLRNVSLDLERFTVLVGPNASGKTTVLEGLYYLSELGHTRKNRDPSCERIPLGLVSAGCDDMILTGSSRTGNVVISIGRSESSISCSHGGGRSSSNVSSEAYESDEYVSLSAPGIVDLGPAVLLRLDATALAQPSYSDEAVPQMTPAGHGLPSVLAYMASNHPVDYHRLLSAVRSVVPPVRDMLFARAKVVRDVSEVIEIEGKEFTHRGQREYWGNSIVFNMDGAPGISAEMASEGTLLVLGLLTVLMGPNRPRLVFLDDLDRALHPKAQEQVVELLRKLLEEHPDMQIVATSHSPYLLHHLAPEEARLTALSEDGSVVCGRLDEHPEFDKWKEEMTPGELWSLFGEQWLVQASDGERG